MHPTTLPASSGTNWKVKEPGVLPGACLVSTIQKMNFLPEALLKVRSLICLSVKILQYTHQEDPVR